MAWGCQAGVEHVILTTMQNQAELNPAELHTSIKLGIDAQALCQRLDRYTRGNLKAFSIVRVPTEDEERQRAFTRQRGQIVRECPSLQLMGRRLRKLRASCSVLMIQFLPMHH